MTVRFGVVVALVASALVAAGCSKKKEDPAAQGTGKAVELGNASDLRLSPDGKRAAYLMDARKPRLEAAPPQLQLGELHLAQLEAGTAKKAGDAVVNTPGAYLFSQDSRWLLFLQAYNVATQQGELLVLDASDAAATPRSLGKQVSYVLPSPDSRWVAFVDDGALRVAELAGQGQPVDVVGQVSNAQFSPDGAFLLAKLRVSAGGGLVVAPVGRWDQHKPLGDEVGDYRVSPDSRYVAYSRRSAEVASTFDLYLAAAPEFAPKKVAPGVTTGAPFAGMTFAFSPDGKYLARTENGRPEQRGDLVVGPADGSPGRTLAANVYRFDFSPDSKAIAYLFEYADNRGPGAGHGFLGAATLPDGAHQKVAERVPNFEWGPTGEKLAFVSRFFKPVYSVDLMLYRTGEKEPKKIAQGVFGYDFSHDGKYLLMRTKCIRDGRACELHTLDLDADGAQPKKVMEGVYSFRTVNHPDRLLATYARIDSQLYDAMAFNLKTGQYKTLERNIQLPVLPASDDGSKVAYVVGERRRAGVYVTTEVP